MNQPNQQPRFVWDWLVRLSHWTVALAIFSNWFLTHYSSRAKLYGDYTLHEWLGFYVLVMVVIRLLWSLSFAQKPARLRDLIPTPAGLKQHFQEMIRREPAREPGHNAFGLLAIWAMWILILAIVISGLLIDTDFGFDHDLDDVHGVLNVCLQIVVALHVSAVIFTSFWCRENLLRPMIHR